MQADKVRFLFAYDRWATRRLLGVLDGLDPALWARTDVVGERVWAASSSTTSALPSAGASDWKRRAPTRGPEPELEPLPTIEEFRERWEAEWAAVDAWCRP